MNTGVSIVIGTNNCIEITEVMPITDMEVVLDKSKGEVMVRLSRAIVEDMVQIHTRDGESKEKLQFDIVEESGITVVGTAAL